MGRLGQTINKALLSRVQIEQPDVDTFYSLLLKVQSKLKSSFYFKELFIHFIKGLE